MSGICTDVVEIVAPSTAVAGERVGITVKIKNTYSSTIGIMVGGALEYGVIPWPSINFPDNWDNVAAGATKTFYGYFTMPYYPPGKVVKIHAYSYWYGRLPDEYWDSWHFDDEKTKDVEIVAPVEPEPTFSQFGVKAFSKA